MIKINKIEAIGILATVGCMALVLYVTRIDSPLLSIAQTQNSKTQAAAIVTSTEGGIDRSSLSQSLQSAMDFTGKVDHMLIDDVLIGNGATVKNGDKVTVNYIGTLQNGKQFDNSYTRGTPFTFTVGAGEVIKGWDQGLIGMKVGGQRILVIPSDLAYGAQGAGPIPANATLVFAIELESVQ